jgi:hypothetical protein
MRGTEWTTESDRLAFHGDTYYAEVFWNASQTADLYVMRMPSRTLIHTGQRLFPPTQEARRTATRQLQVEAEQVIQRDSSAAGLAP